MYSTHQDTRKHTIKVRKALARNAHPGQWPNENALALGSPVAIHLSKFAFSLPYT